MSPRPRSAGGELGPVKYRYGKPIAYKCATPKCSLRSAAYPGRFPYGWTRDGNKVYCPTHSKKEEEEEWTVR